MAKIFWRIALVFVFVLIIAACSGGTNYVGIAAVPETVTTFTVKFDTAGGSDVDSQVVEKGRFASEPEPPVKDGFKFSGGWFIINYGMCLYYKQAECSVFLRIYI